MFANKEQQTIISRIHISQELGVFFLRILVSLKSPMYNTVLIQANKRYRNVFICTVPSFKMLILRYVPINTNLAMALNHLNQQGNVYFISLHLVKYNLFVL